MQEMDKKEIIKLVDVSIIYIISNSCWVSPTQIVPKKESTNVVTNENNELIPTQIVIRWCVCVDYRKLNTGTRKDHYLLSFIEEVLERLRGNNFYFFLDGYSGYFKILVALENQEEITFTCPCGTFAY